MEARLYQLQAQSRQIANEQAYQRVRPAPSPRPAPAPTAPQTREATFRELSESTNVRVLWWSVGQVVVLVLVGFVQYHFLVDYLKNIKNK